MSKKKHAPTGGYRWQSETEDRRAIEKRNREIRDRIIAAAQKDPPEIDIPPISRPWLEVIDPLGIDETLLEKIENGEEELTDELFFECLSDSPKYLVYAPFQERIARWQSTIHDKFLTGEEKEEARGRLNKIGTTLAFVGSGRPTDERKEFEIYMHLKHMEKQLIPIMREIENLFPANKVLTFKERCPDLKEYASVVRYCHAPGSAAREIIQQIYGIKERTLDKIIKKHETMMKRTRLRRVPIAKEELFDDPEKSSKKA